MKPRNIIAVFQGDAAVEATGADVDKQLYTKYDITEYKGFIESMIKPME